MAEPLKNQFGRAVIDLLAESFGAAHPSFRADRFESTLRDTFGDLELKDRVNLVADTLAEQLPPDYARALEIVVAVARSGVEGFAAWPLCSFVERHGVEHAELSLEAMEILTGRWSCEFAIRPFLDHHLELTRSYLRRWVEHDDESVRRLVSEGTRPKLPWGPKVQALVDDPDIGLELLEQLRRDGSETVRRSVANHLNDLAKLRPDLVVAVARRWVDDPDGVEPAMIRHALRTLVKQGHPEALAVLGFTTEPEVEIEAFTCDPAELRLGESIVLEVVLESTAVRPQRLVIDFVIHHVKASGATAAKVFKWTNIDLGPGERVELSKRRQIQTASTRRYHRGFHAVDLQIAGRRWASTGFDLLDSSG